MVWYVSFISRCMYDMDIHLHIYHIAAISTVKCDNVSTIALYSTGKCNGGLIIALNSTNNCNVVPSSNLHNVHLPQKSPTVNLVQTFS